MTDKQLAELYRRLEHIETVLAKRGNQRDTTAQQTTAILSRLDRLEAALTERHFNYQQRQERIDVHLADHDDRIRAVEVSAAKLVAIITTGSTLGGVIGGTIVTVGKALGAF